MSTGKRKSNFGSTGTFSDDLDNWKVGSKMDSTLINTFRNEVNDQDLVLQMYHSRDGKALWNIICSAMDWIDVVVGEIDVHKLLRGNDNKSSIHFITFISCADVLWEAIQQLHRVFFAQIVFHLLMIVPYLKTNYFQQLTTNISKQYELVLPLTQ